ncbi:MAG: formate/nitrite transporter family protein [Lachnospiraceae bacterium]|nr:formate/nitrite transporter family protein [Lachnospiraceae bacterium]
MNTPAEIAQNYVGIGKKKTELPVSKMLLLGILAGLFIAVGGTAFEMATAMLGGSIVGKFIGACLFPAGLTLVLVAGSELFTGNCLLIIPLMEKETRLSAVVKSWVVVYIGNFIGSALMAALVVYGHSPSQMDNGLLNTIMSVASGKVGLSFGDAFIRGIICNILVCLAVWMSFAAKSFPGKMMAAFYPIMIFVFCGFEHSIANMYYLMAGIFANSFYAVGNPDVTVGAMLVNNLLPVTIGNMIGGMAVGLSYWFIYLKGNRK